MKKITLIFAIAFVLLFSIKLLEMQKSTEDATGLSISPYNDKTDPGP